MLSDILKLELKIVFSFPVDEPRSSGISVFLSGDPLLNPRSGNI